MRHFFSITFLSGLLVSLGVCSCNFAPKDRKAKIAGDTSSYLLLEKFIPLPHVKDGFDLMAIDIQSQRLFVSAEDNHSVEIINLKSGKPITSLPGFNEPKWIFYLPENNWVYVSTGGDGKVTELDGNTYKVLNTFSFKEACNNLRFDSVTNQLYVGVGKTFGSLGIIDVKKDRIVGEIPLSGYAKQFEIDGDRVYINLPQKNVVEVVSIPDAKIIADWPVIEAKENVPMALDRNNHRLFIACEPGKFIIYSTQTGKAIQSFDIAKNADGIYYDAKRSRILVSCGEGNIEIIQQTDADHYQLLHSVTTAKGAGTSLFSGQLDKYILAVPQSNENAEIRVYKPVN
ncbi:MAG: YncE family protein [Bacteroidota bacterium]